MQVNAEDNMATFDRNYWIPNVKNGRNHMFYSDLQHEINVNVIRF
jgi:hypothetical protein